MTYAVSPAVNYRLEAAPSENWCYPSATRRWRKVHAVEVRVRSREQQVPRKNDGGVNSRPGFLTGS